MVPIRGAAYEMQPREEGGAKGVHGTEARRRRDAESIHDSQRSELVSMHEAEHRESRPSARPRCGSQETPFDSKDEDRREDHRRRQKSLTQCNDAAKGKVEPELGRYLVEARARGPEYR